MPPASRGRGMGSSQVSGNTRYLAVLGVLVVGTLLLTWPAQTRRDMAHSRTPLGPGPTTFRTGDGEPRKGGGLDPGEALGDGVFEEEPSTGLHELGGVGWDRSTLRQGPGAPGYPQGKDDIHVVFSTDCSTYQRWQAVVLFHSAILSGHLGPITQLISGCSDEDMRELSDTHKRTSHSDNHRLFFTPSFSMKNPKTGEEYPYMNKPNALSMWFNQTKVPESVVALIDPDFIFLKPLTTWMSPTETVVRGDGLSLEGLDLEEGDWIRKGHPAGQRFGLPNWTKWDRTRFCPKESPCATAMTSTAKKYYDLIPPYLAHKEDWLRILPEWVDQAPKVYGEYPYLLAEQTAYSTAAATLDLKHYRINNYAIESEKVDYEAWDVVDYNMGNVCDVGIEDGDGTSRGLRSFRQLPTFIHYCHMYRVGYWLFNKRRYRKDQGYDQLGCQTPLLELPPAEIQKDAFKMHPGSKFETITPRAAKRNAFVLCIATRFVNSALRRFKDLNCPDDTANLEETVRIE